jgi:hypothetical protein
MAKVFNNFFSGYKYYILLAYFTISSVRMSPLAAQSELQMYNPIPLPSNQEISDNISDRDIPTGEGGFARDYSVDLTSDDFDTVVVLVAADGTTVAENDDGPDGTTNSLLFARVTEKGRYIVRVRAFGETGAGKFNLKVTRLQPINK